jgi:glucose-6-phosphate isomerase/transaldolase/glucose-6-phosphate isomerase
MEGLRRLRMEKAVTRLWERDATLFSDDPAVQALDAERFGWLGLAARAAADAAALAPLAAELLATGITDIVLLGMGGSSLAPLVMSRILGPLAGTGMRLHVLDTTSPTAVAAVQASLLPGNTLVIVASKSGTTIEPLSLYSVFRTWTDATHGDEAGAHFIAITDPGSHLETLAGEQGFSAVFRAPADVGGRYSALTPFGTVPAALIGIDVADLARRAAVMEAACRNEVDDNPGAQLAAFMGNGHAEGRDKVTIVCSERIASFGLWAEQLIAESSGKLGLGFVPVLDTPDVDPGLYGDDRLVVTLSVEGDTSLDAYRAKVRPDTPRLEIRLGDEHDIAGEFVRWEVATALACFLIGVEPFDQPNVAVAKKATDDILAGRVSAPPKTCDDGDVEVTILTPDIPAACSAPDAVDALVGHSHPGDYLAILAYLPDDEDLIAPLREAVAAISSARRIAVTLEIGPRYLHSTGQLHKGGPATGRYLIVTTRDDTGPSIPGKPFTLAQLHRAQAEGDLATLVALGRPVVRLDLPAPWFTYVAAVAHALTESL